MGRELAAYNGPGSKEVAGDAYFGVHASRNRRRSLWYGIRQPFRFSMLDRDDDYLCGGVQSSLARVRFIGPGILMPDLETD